MKHPKFTAFQAVAVTDILTGHPLVMVYGLTESGEIYEKIGNGSKKWTIFDNEVEP